MAWRLGGLLGALALAGCASALPYTPAEQPAGIRLAAGAAVVGDRLRVPIDTAGYRLEQAWILRPDGVAIGPLTVEPPARGDGIGLGIGLGTAGRSGSVSIGTGFGLGTGIGSPRGGRHPVAVFPLDQIGPAPWRLQVKAVGIQPAVIVLDPARR
jgi:hypothetical protein